MRWRPARRIRGCAVVVGVIAGSLLVAGCGPEGLNFRQDHRLAISDPEDFSSVTLPLTVHWRFTDSLGAPGGPAQFAVFLDAAPIAPGDSVASLDKTARRAVTLTTSTALPIASVDSGSGSSSRTQHDVTVVLLDSSGNRLGETAAHVAFYVGG